MARILVADDERSLREFLQILLEQDDHEVHLASRGDEAIKMSNETEYDLVFTDLRMPGKDGLEVLRSIRDLWPETQVIMITAHGTAHDAVQAMKLGAYDYITKPFNVDELRQQVRLALDKRGLLRENVQLRQQLSEKYTFGNLIGRSDRMRQVCALLSKVADTRANILLTGESGTGKEMVAKAIHFNSARAKKPFIPINCGAIPENLMESELFGHVKGSFTGAISNKMGLVEGADGGTLFLDEIGELPLNLQVKLLRVLQERKFKRVGDVEERAVDARFIAATNVDLEDLVKRKLFREDLFYRLNVIHIQLPPLRERKDDIPLLADAFVRKFARESGKDIRGFDAGAMACLMNYDYSGNVRQLENIVERSVTLESGNTITVDSLPAEVRSARPAPAASFSGMPDTTEFPRSGVDFERVVEDLEKRMLTWALRETGGRKTEAAQLLRLSFRSFRYRLKKYNMSGPDDEGD
ncbi:MAG: Regulatory protein AtoC [Myxococcota bacterium]|nr:Regulatory protein AtoC [Myxococcota bacterium]